MKKLLLLTLFSLVAYSNPAVQQSVITSSTEYIAVSTATSVQIAQDRGATGNRRYILIVNKGANTAYITKAPCIGGPTEGVPLPTGWNWEPNVTPLNALCARSNGGNTDLLVVEGQ